MTETTSEVKAKFGGEERIFTIPRDRLEAFEIAIGEPAQMRLRRLVTGTASAQHVREVLEFSAPPGLGRKLPRNRMEAQLAAATADFAHGDTAAPFSTTPVAKAIAARPPGRFHLLAQAVIAACLYGIPAGAAFFDEDDDGADVQGGVDAA